MRLLVTGASGFIGRNVLCATRTDWTVTATYHRSLDFPEFLAVRELAHVKPVRVDLANADADELRRAVGGEYDAVVFLAANGDPALSVERPREDLAANALSLVALLEHVRASRLVFASSGAVYDGLSGDVRPGAPLAPRLPYAISKLAAERYLESFVRRGTIASAVSVRLFGAYGPHEPERKIYTRLVRAFAGEGRRRFTIRGDGQNLIDAMYVDDTVRALMSLMLDHRPVAAYEVFDLAAGAAVSVEQLVRLAAATFGAEPELEFSGTVPEYIRFRSVDTAMRDRYAFRPSVPLADGLLRLARHLGCPVNAGRASS